jgi:hypothetical protein
MSSPSCNNRPGQLTGNPTPGIALAGKYWCYLRIDDCTSGIMSIQREKPSAHRTGTNALAITAKRVVVAIAGGIGIVLLARWWSKSRPPVDEFGVIMAAEQAITIKKPVEAVEEGWVQWCASGHAKLRNDYAIRFEPAPGARGTEVHLSGGGSAGTIREELRRFKQRLETGEIQLSDGPGLSRPAQPRDSDEVKTLAEV